MTRDPSDQNNNLPPWLRDVPLPPRPRGANDRAAAPIEPPPGAGLPDWLHDTSAQSASAADAPSWMDSPTPTPLPAQTSDAAALPDWLRETEPTPPPSPSTASGQAAGSEQLPSWLSDLAGTDAPAPEPPPAPPAAAPPSESNLPDWLRETQRDAAPPSDARPLPDWLSESSQAPSDAAPPAGETPPWLSDLTGEAPAADEPSAVPDWLGGISDDAPPPASSDPGIPSWLSAENPAAAEPPAVPDWLRSADEQPSPPKPPEPPSLDLWADEPSPAPTPPRSTSGDAGVPDWLRDISGQDTDDITAEPFTFGDAQSGSSPAEPDGPPAWLSDADEITAEPFTFGDAQSGSPPAEPAGPPAWLSGGEDSSEGVPEWLRSAVDQSEELAGAAPELPAVPLWLQDVENQPPAPSAPEANNAPAAAPADSETLPPWLRDQAAQSPTASSPAADVPSWLREPEPSTPVPPPAADVPDWLRAPETSAPTPPPAADIPAWLQSEPPSAGEASTAFTPAPDADTLPGIGRADLSAPPPPPTPADDLPEWLRPNAPGAAPAASAGQDLPPWLRDESGQPLPTAGLAGDSKLPAWLRGVAADAPPATPVNEPAPAPTPVSFDWLDQATEAETRRGSSESEFFGSTELPAWLRPPEPEQPKEISQADARSLDWLSRLGGTDEPEMPVSATVAAPKLTPLVPRPRSAAQIEALGLLQRLAAAPFPEPAALPAPAQPSMLRRVGMERALYLALLIALIIGLLVPLPDSFGLATPPTAPGATDLLAQIDQLSENDVVLVGYEWDARRSSELRPLEDAVLGHLIQRKVKLVLASTDPQGTLLLFDFRDQLERAGYRQGGEDYILLGYKPGAELALRSFAQDFRAALRSDFQGNDATISALATGNDPNKPRLASLADFSMVMVLADEAPDVQGWMEQVHRSAPQVPFAFLLPAETTPIVQPYLSQRGIFHLAGKQGALAYQSLRGEGAMPAAQIARETAQQRLSQLLFIALLLVGAIVLGVSAAAARRRRPA